MLSFTAFTSPGSAQPCQNFKVTGFVGSSRSLPTLGRAHPDTSSPAPASATIRNRPARMGGMAYFLYGGKKEKAAGKRNKEQG
ncbi:hypothetical protein GCM10017688_29180 [Streptomyces ramulosus]